MVISYKESWLIPNLHQDSIGFTIKNIALVPRLTILQSINTIGSIATLGRDCCQLNRLQVFHRKMCWMVCLLQETHTLGYLIQQWRMAVASNGNITPLSFAQKSCQSQRIRRR